ncbi:membrane fusion protein, cobalt-zinc-cadmium efflux system [Reichenbachiella faecimaris]|uniref:Membrane fusion protein, cobalt-zinc-cadmium efflux system n=1 Tax=Reichenbachiella faecimaris TaxID=692418 RepID=A0A1W2G567_REIFA|nr:efflux RND transporter periplasmic adaptor subunit [Reichenbachiella faecimaris]SMD31810.1 membrane fusion protein, cobalt-zinc-cadmium efflux system [Reichenbachiella faecimaris]
MSITNIKSKILFLPVVILMVACGKPTVTENNDHEEKEGHGDKVHFSVQQFQSLEMKVDTIPRKNLSSYVEANGELEVPPQNEATVTAIIGANVSLIKVIEGDKVRKGQVLAYISHPNLIQLQTDYVNAWNQFHYLEKEYQRQKKLYEEKVGSGKEFQKIQAEFKSMDGTVKGLEAQLRLFGLNTGKIQTGKIYEQVPVKSPIEGFIRLVEVKTGQYVQPQTEMFEVVNIDHIHADLMVFEKDMSKVKKGQKVKFKVESSPDKELEAEIYSVGKAFEQDPKAIHLHAEIENKEGLLIPGMYVRGRILVDEVKAYALPRQGVAQEGEKFYIFSATKEDEGGEIEWEFEPIEVVLGTEDDGWVEIKPLETLNKNSIVAWNNAYYLLAEMKKGEAEHEH